MDRPWPLVFEGLNTAAFRTTAAGKAPLAVAARTTREAAAAGLPDACAVADLSRYEFSRAATNYYRLNLQRAHSHVCGFPPVWVLLSVCFSSELEFLHKD